MGIGGGRGFILGKEELEEVVGVVGRKVKGVELNGEVVGERVGMREMGWGCGILVRVVLLGVVDKEGLEVIWVLLEEGGRKGGMERGGDGED